MAKSAPAKSRRRRERGSINVGRNHQRRLRSRRRSLDGQPEHAAVGQASRRRRDEHLLVLPQEGRPLGCDDRPGPSRVQLHRPVDRRRQLARVAAQTRPNDAPDVSEQSGSLRPRPDPRHVQPRSRPQRAGKDRAARRRAGSGRAEPGGRVRHLRGDRRAHPRLGGAGAAAGQDGRAGGQRGQADRRRGHAAHRRGFEEGPPHRSRRRHQLRLHPRLDPRSCRAIDRPMLDSTDTPGGPT